MGRERRGRGSWIVWAALVGWACWLSGAGTLSAQDGGAPDARELTDEVVRLLGRALLEESSIPGLAVAVGDTTGIVVSRAFGYADLGTGAPATPLTRWRIGSIGKGLTAAGAVLLAERELLELDRPASAYVAAVAGRPAGAATARQLAGHRGGVRHYREGEGIRHDHYHDVVDALEIFADDTLVAAPGEAYAYSTFGYTLLSAVMQEAAGASFLTWMEREVFRPLGLRHTGPDVVTRVVPGRASFYEIRDGELVPAPFTDNSYKWAGGGFLSTPEDLVRFATGLLEGRLLSRAGTESLFASQRTRDGEKTGYGMGFRPRTDWTGRPVAHHGGSSEGGRAFLLIHPAEGVVVAMAANRATAPLFEEEAQTVAHFLLEHGPASEAVIDQGMAGAWPARGTLGDDGVTGSLRLWAGGRSRGVLEWGEGRAPIRVVLVDRHGAELQLVGVGPHGVMKAWLEPSDATGVGEPTGWTGRWNYLGRDGELTVGGQAAGAPDPPARPDPSEARERSPREARR